MKKILAFSLFDTGETILGALIYSVFFPLYITKHIDPKVYSWVYSLTFLISFLFALHIGKYTDKTGKRKEGFVIFATTTAFLCFLLGFTSHNPFVSLMIFSLMSISHQQSFVFYNSLLLNFDTKGLASGLGVSFGYVGSAIALIFFAKVLSIPDVYFITALIFFLFALPSMIFLKNPSKTNTVNLREIFKDKRFILTIISILSLTEVANTLIAMMSIYLKNVFGFEDVEIYKIIGLSAVGGIFGGIFWGIVSDKFTVNRIFPIGFFLWVGFLIILTFIPKNLVLIAGFFAGFSLAHLWTVSRVYIVSHFPQEEIATRMSFLSLTERLASTTGLFVWGLLLWITSDNYKLSALLMAVFPLFGLVVFLYSKRFSI
ncbi:MFS transporter [Sulfurihydrogenibium sp.]|uniref:MFS transporter n=1 Tax=Sulfurihydrogenibium sp. TaxID=2053621 RepID=UPI00261DF130|nr:MFS transporter [Sulfurihydrogenibium sp.]